MKTFFKSRKNRILKVPYYWMPILVSVLIFLLGILNLNEIYTAVTGSRFSDGASFLFGNGPFSVLILFLSITFVALTLDVSGFLEYLSIKVLKRVHCSGTKLFIAVYAMTSILTLFTSNDILILTLTPFLLCFFRNLKINPVPFLVAEFFAANILSMGLLIGNPTNIIVATSFGLNFIEYFKIMIFPALTAGLTSFVLLYFVFRNEIKIFYRSKKLPEAKLTGWSVLSVILLSGTLLSLTILSMWGILLWHISLAWAFLSFLLFGLPQLFVTLNSGKSPRASYLVRIFKQMPWEIVPFVLGFFIIIETFSATGMTAAVTGYLSGSFGKGLFSSVFGVGILSTLSANLFNNIPMTVFFSGLLENFAAGESHLGALYALIMGSNLGANLTPIGSLAGIMWLKMLKQKKIKLTFRQFMIYGFKVTIATTLVTLLSIYAVFALF